MKDILINDRYRVDHKIGEGGYGIVYSGTDLQSNGEAAIKLAYVRDGPYVLQGEADMYKALAGGVGIPRVLWFGQECDFYVLVQEALGPSLEDLFNYCNRRFSLKTILLLADRPLPGSSTYIRKASSIVTSNQTISSWELASKGIYYIQSTSAWLRNIPLLKNIDSTNIASLEALSGMQASRTTLSKAEQSWGDDLESLGYIFVYLARGSLPWQGLKASTEKEKDDSIKERKMNLSGEALCEGILPGEFATYINYTRSLGFEDKPDYAYLRRLFRRLFTAKVFKYDNIFDWTEKRFHEIHGTVNPPEPPTPTDLQKRKPRPLPSTKAPREMVSAGERR